MKLQSSSSHMPFQTGCCDRCSSPCPSMLVCHAWSICWYTWYKFTLRIDTSANVFSTFKTHLTETEVRYVEKEANAAEDETQWLRHSDCYRHCSPPRYAAAVDQKSHPLKSLQLPWCKTKDRPFFPHHVSFGMALQTAFSPAFIGAQTAGIDVKTWLTMVKVIVASRTTQMLCLSVQQLWFIDTVPTDGTQEELRDHKTSNTQIYIALKIYCLSVMLCQILKLQTLHKKYIYVIVLDKWVASTLPELLQLVSPSPQGRSRCKCK